MDEIILVGFAVVEKIGRFPVVGTFYGLGLQSGRAFAIKTVFDGHRG